MVPRPGPLSLPSSYPSLGFRWCRDVILHPPPALLAFESWLSVMPRCRILLLPFLHPSLGFQWYPDKAIIDFYRGLFSLALLAFRYVSNPGSGYSIWNPLEFRFGTSKLDPSGIQIQVQVWISRFQSKPDPLIALGRIHGWFQVFRIFVTYIARGME